MLSIWLRPIFFPFCKEMVIVLYQTSLGKQLVAWKEYFAEYWLKQLQESMDSCTGHCDLTEMLLKTAINIIHSNFTFVH